MGVFSCFCSHYESDNSQYFILHLAWSEGLIHCWWHRDLRARRNSVSGNIDSPFLQIRSLTKETIPLLGAECPALPATSGAHVTSTPHPRHMLPLHKTLMLLSLPQLCGVALDSPVLSYIQFYLWHYQFNLYAANFSLQVSFSYKLWGQSSRLWLFFLLFSVNAFFAQFSVFELTYHTVELRPECSLQSPWWSGYLAHFISMIYSPHPSPPPNFSSSTHRSLPHHPSPPSASSTFSAPYRAQCRYSYLQGALAAFPKHPVGALPWHSWPSPCSRATQHHMIAFTWYWPHGMEPPGGLGLSPFHLQFPNTVLNLLWLPTVSGINEQINEITEWDRRKRDSLLSSLGGQSGILI